VVETWLQERSERFAARVDGLASALRAAGVSEEDASRLLTLASEAVLNALTLELLVAERKPEPRSEAESARTADSSLAEPDLRLAA
jgi:SOS response regulatory protein OraA/RecX